MGGQTPGSTHRSTHRRPVQGEGNAGRVLGSSLGIGSRVVLGNITQQREQAWAPKEMENPPGDKLGQWYR